MRNITRCECARSGTYALQAMQKSIWRYKVDTHRRLQARAVSIMCAASKEWM